MTESANEPKYGRGQNPRALANLKAPWTKGTRPNPYGQRGPIITPEIAKFARMSVDELRNVDKEKLTGGQAIAYVMVLKGMLDTHGGDRAREQILERLDGINKLVFELARDGDDTQLLDALLERVGVLNSVSRETPPEG